MAHEIEEHDTMMSVRQTPWHRLGTVIPDYTTPEDAARNCIPVMARVPSSR